MTPRRPDETNRLRVLVAEDYPAVLERLRWSLERDFDVVAAVLDGTSALSETLRLSPDVLVCDISMPGMNGFQVARELKLRSSATKVVFVTINGDSDYVAEALRVGAGFVLKSAPAGKLFAAVRAAAAGEIYVWCGSRVSS